MKRFVIAFGILVVSMLGALSAQTPAPAGQSAAGAQPNPVWPGKVYISGENPGITLREKAGAPPLANVSYWRIHWSPVGTGSVCYVTTGDGKGSGDLRIALYDNQKLYDYLTNQMMAVFNQAYQDRPFTPIGGATFGRSGDAVKEYREICNSDKYKVELVWQGLEAPRMINREPGRPDNPFGLTYLQIPSTKASITINGKQVPGGVFAAEGGGGGAILAFGETWRRLQ